MALSITEPVGTQVNCSVPVELDQNGNNFPIVPANMVWATDDEAVSGPLTTNADGSASFTGVAAGTANITVTDSKYTLTSPPGAATFTPVVVPAPVSISFTFA